MPNLRLNRDQLYKAAAMASAGAKTEVVFSIDEDSGPIRLAIPVRDNAVESMVKQRHDNGYAYYTMGPEGHTKPIKEDEL
jgi:hypothetical protein